ncbi:HEAT repeat domain-containing protein [Gemmatimonadota bacterium]
MDITEFLIEAARALQRYGMYPDGHPSRISTADELLQGLAEIIRAGGDLTIQVDQNHLVIGDLVTDEKNNSATNFARRLHQHQLHVIIFKAGISRQEVDGLFSIISSSVGKSIGEPFGASPPELLAQWPHIAIEAIPYDAMRLSEGSDGFDDDSPGYGIGSRGRTGGVAGVDGGGGTGAAGVPTELQLQIARLFENLDTTAQQRLLKMFQALVHADGVDGSHDKAVLKLVELTRKGGSKQSTTMLGILSKIGKQVGASEVDGPSITPGTILGELIRQLSGEEVGGEVVEEDAGPVEKPEWIGEIEADRVLQMSIELEEMTPAGQKRLKEIAAGGDLKTLDMLIKGAPQGNPVLATIVEWLARPKTLQKMLASETLDLATLDLLLPLVGTAAIEPMMDLLSGSDDEQTRKELVTRLIAFGEPVGPLALERIDDPRWEIRSALLTILSRITPLPTGFTTSVFYLDDDRRVRLQAMKFGLARGESRGDLILAALRDPDDEIGAFGLDEVKKRCPEETAQQIIETALKGRETTSVRRTCIRAMGVLDDPEVLDALLELTWQRRVFILYILTPKTPEMLEALSVIASKFGSDPRAKAVLKAARKSKDPQIKTVVVGRGVGT